MSPTPSPPAALPIPAPDAIALDLDGVVWLGGRPIPGAAAAIDRLRDRGCAVCFVTNNSHDPKFVVERRLQSMGIAARGDVVTSADAAAALVGSGARVLVCGGPGIHSALQAHGSATSDGGDAALDATPGARFDAVVVGLTPSFDYAMLRRAMVAVEHGATLIGTNDDPTYPSERGPLPGGGSILAAVATASGVEPTVAGKPHAPMVELVRKRLGPKGMMIGDRPETDGRFAEAMQVAFGLVLSGVTAAPDLPVEPAPAIVGKDLAGLVEQLEASSPRVADTTR